MTPEDRLSSLLTKSRQASLGDNTRQRASFALGNGNIESDEFSRATVTMAVMPDGELRTPGPDDDTTSKQDNRRVALNSTLRQYDLMVDLITRYTAPNALRFVLSPELIISLQAVLSFPGGPQSGYRHHQVRIATNDFIPISPEKISGAVDELCAFVNRSWETSDALTLSAYALWRLNWIHPFGDGNGRTARALSYLILSIKLGSVLPGAPTIPEQLLQRRADYFDALANVDRAYRERDVVDVAPLYALIHKMLLRQLDAAPALAPEDITSVHDLVNQRVRNAPDIVIKKIFGSSKIEERLWSVDDHLILQIGPQVAIAEAEAMLSRTGSPFPRLLSSRDSTSGRLVKSLHRGLILRSEHFDATEGYALALEHNAAVTLEQPQVSWRTSDGIEESWKLPGTLYIIRLGREVTLARAAETIDILLARHMVAHRQ